MTATPHRGAGAPRSRRFREGRQRLAAAQKPGEGVPAYLRWVNRRAGRVVAAAAYSIGASPNAVIAASFALSFTGLVVLVLAPVSLTTGLVVAVLLALGYAFDSADGQLARLYGIPSAAGEWLDHVVDAFRAPMIHLAVALAVVLTAPDRLWLVAVALTFSVVTSGQFLSQILSGAMLRNYGGAPTRGGTARSFILLPTDAGVICWMFVLWGVPAPFAAVYTVLAIVAVLHSASSLQRRYRDLSQLDQSRKDGGHA